MLDLTGYGRLTQLTTLTDRMVNDASREAIVTAARMLAVQLGHYQRKFGVMPFDESVDLLESTGLNEEQAGQVADGLELLAMAMATVKDEEQPPPLQ
jgi:hypothetical protein